MSGPATVSRIQNKGAKAQDGGNLGISSSCRFLRSARSVRPGRLTHVEGEEYRDQLQRHFDLCIPIPTSPCIHVIDALPRPQIAAPSPSPGKETDYSQTMPACHAVPRDCPERLLIPPSKTFAQRPRQSHTTFFKIGVPSTASTHSPEPDSLLLVHATKRASSTDFWIVSPYGHTDGAAKPRLSPAPSRDSPAQKRSSASQRARRSAIQPPAASEPSL
ncbi:hypothetical protein R3P38DRAFT_3102441, partial [Favolaschia claudopus]